jgi:hypothetical protein
MVELFSISLVKQQLQLIRRYDLSGTVTLPMSKHVETKYSCISGATFIDWLFLLLIRLHVNRVQCVTSAKCLSLYVTYVIAVLHSCNRRIAVIGLGLVDAEEPSRKWEAYGFTWRQPLSLCEIHARCWKYAAFSAFCSVDRRKQTFLFQFYTVFLRKG